MNYKILLLIFAFFPLWVFSQNDTLTKKELRKQRPSYIKAGVGTGYAYFRDFATSPLNYGGMPLSASLSYMKSDSLRENELGINSSFGQYIATDENSSGMSQVNVMGIYYSRLYRINKLSSKKWNIKVGGMFDATIDYRGNEELMNNGGGSELFATLFASAKATRDISRNNLKHKKIWFVKYQLKPRKQNLSFRLNMAVINSTYRNGYVYNGQAYLVNDMTSFDNYEFNIFSGYRMSSCIDYTYYLKNKNALQFSYVWDAYKTGGDYDKFEMASHIFKFSLLFNTK